MSAASAEPTPGTGRTRASRIIRTVVGIVLVAALAVGATIAYVAHQRRGSDPRYVSLPAATGDANATRLFMGGRGAPIVALLRITAKPVPARPADCAAFVRSLTTAGQPRRLADLALQIPEAAVRDAAVSHVRATVAAVAHCGSAQGGMTARRMAFTQVVLERLLRREGVSP